MKRMAAFYENSPASFALYDLSRVDVDNTRLSQSTQKRVE